MLNDSRLTTFDNPYDPFDQFVEWYLFDTEKGYNTCGKLDRITHYSEDMTEKEIDEEHERAVDEIVDNDIFNVYKKVYRNKITKSEISKIPA